MAKKKALGKGLNAIFDAEGISPNAMAQIEASIKPNEIIEIKLSDLKVNPYQPRSVFDENALEELSKSIIEYGVFTPIIVRKALRGYEIIAGERRFRASKMANLETIPAVIRDFSDALMMEIALVENLQRENLTVIEEAIAYQNLIKELELTHDSLAKRVGKSRSHITNILGLLKLPDDVIELVNNNTLTMGHARTLSKLEDHAMMRKEAKKIVEGNLTVRDIEKISKKRDVKVNIFHADLEEALSSKLNRKVKITNNQLNISFVDDKDLNNLLDILKLGDKDER